MLIKGPLSQRPLVDENPLTETSWWMKKLLTETHPSTEQGNVSRKYHPNIGPHKDLNKDLMVDENPLTETHPSTK